MPQVNASSNSSAVALRSHVDATQSASKNDPPTSHKTLFHRLRSALEKFELNLSTQSDKVRKADRHAAKAVKMSLGTEGRGNLSKIFSHIKTWMNQGTSHSASARAPSHRHANSTGEMLASAPHSSLKKKSVQIDETQNSTFIFEPSAHRPATLKAAENNQKFEAVAKEVDTMLRELEEFENGKALDRQLDQLDEMVKAPAADADQVDQELDRLVDELGQLVSNDYAKPESPDASSADEKIKSQHRVDKALNDILRPLEETREADQKNTGRKSLDTHASPSDFDRLLDEIDALEKSSARSAADITSPSAHGNVATRANTRFEEVEKQVDDLLSEIEALEQDKELDNLLGELDNAVKTPVADPAHVNETLDQALDELEQTLRSASGNAKTADNP